MISGACASLCATATSAGTIQKNVTGGKPNVHVVASTNITTKVVVQTIGPDGARNVKMFNSGSSAQGNAATGDAAPAVTWLGVTTEAASDELRAQLSLDPGVGLTVFGVSPGGPAAKAGLQVHDILVRLGDQILMDPDQLKNLVRAKKAGDRVALTYLRKGKESSAELTLAEHAELAADAVHVINMGDFTVDVNQLLQQMPQVQRQMSVSPAPTFSFSSSSGSSPEDVEAILKNLKIDDTNVSRIVEETVRKALKDVQAAPEK
jgi:membrane-associated protease RseP (regulator of RpoE activity)